MPLRSVRFSIFVIVTIGVILFGCGPSLSGVENPLEAINSIQNTMTDNILAEIMWAYQDEYRFAFEISIENYPLPSGFRTRCPITQVSLSNAEEEIPLYKNPEQIDLDEFYSLIKSSKWLCSLQQASSGKADYLFSLSYFYPSEKTDIDVFNGQMISIELGEIIADNSTSVITLPNRGIFQRSIDNLDDQQGLTWVYAEKITKGEVVVQIDRVSVNPSLVFMDACIDFQDNHVWRPRAALNSQGHYVVSEESLPLSSDPEYRGESRIADTHRCNTFFIPLDFQLDLVSNFIIGIDQIQIDNTNSAHISQSDCENVKVRVEKLYPGLEIKCFSFELREESHEWFELISIPGNLSQEETFSLVESTFNYIITGPWEVEIEVDN